MVCAAPRKSTGKEILDPSESADKGKRRRQESVRVHIDEGLLLDLSDDPRSVEAAATELKQKAARQKKKPMRFGDIQRSQDMTPKTGLV